MPLTPNNREEHWLQGMVDGETTLTPNKRREYWYKEIVEAIGSGGGGGGTGGGVLVIDPSENNSVTIGGVTYNKITFVPNQMVDASFILVDPSVLTSPQAIFFYDSANQGYVLMTRCASAQTGTISSDNVNQDNIYPVSPITLWSYFSESIGTPYFLIPNNATYAVGTKGK